MRGGVGASDDEGGTGGARGESGTHRARDAHDVKGTFSQGE